jgi:alpha-galactosidase
LIAMPTRAILTLAFAAAADTRSKSFPPGWNGLAQAPPLGWRSWNAFGNRITQALMEQQLEALTAKSRSVPGRAEKVSLAELGYGSFGIDEGWEACGQGVNRTQHAADGRPVVEKAFPDLSALVASGHKQGLRMGWYLNGCKCGEHVEKSINYQGDVASLHELGFDEVKIDGCGKQLNMTYYAELMKATGKSYSIENCHWGRCSDSDASSCPTQDWCPFNWYRTSGDINSSPQSWVRNLQTTRRFQDKAQPLSRPGCWAYPDMLEVGRVRNPGNDSHTWYTWNRAHFGAWCIVSAPLILGLELSDAALAPVLDIIGNEEAIRVNQIWDGSPGYLVKEDGGLQIWAKPQRGALAVLAINNSPQPLASYPVSLAALDFYGRVAVRDVWARGDRAPVAGGTLELTVGAYDSEFLVLKAATEDTLYA